MELRAFICPGLKKEKELNGIPLLEPADSLSKTVADLKANVLILAVEKDQVSDYISEIIKCGQACHNCPAANR